MQSLVRSIYTKEEVSKFLQTSGRSVRFRYELLNRELKSLGWLDTVESARVENNHYAQVKRTGVFDLRSQSGWEVNFVIDLIRPHFELLLPNGVWASWPLGTFLMETSTEKTNTEGTKRSVKGFDQLLILKEDNFTNRYSIPKSVGIRAKVIEIIESAGISKHSISDSAAVTPFALEWPIGTPKLEVINELLRAMGFGSLYFSAAGVAVGQPWTSPFEQGYEYHYVSEFIAPEIEVSLDLARVPNQWVGYTSSSDGTSLRSVYTNDNPDSFTSTVNRGRVVSAAPIRATAADQAALDIIVKQKAQADSQVYQETKFITPKMPHHGDNDTLRLTAPHASMDFTGQERSWSMSLEPAGVMEHVIQKMVIL